MSQNLKTFIIYPILGLKNDVPQNDESLLRFIGEGAALTHDAGGVNIDYTRKRNTCTKAYGKQKLTNTANSQATKCLGLFELNAGDNRDMIVIDNGKFYYLDGSLDPTIVQDASSITFATDNVDLYSMIQVGDYVVFADRGEHTPYKWKNGDTTLSKLIASGTEYKFRYLERFQRRVIGAYSDQTNGDIDVRWSSSWPGTAITSMTFSSGNQLYIPNDDTITGIKRMGRDRCFVYSEDSIHSLDYYPYYETPFALRNVADGQGCDSNHSIVNLGDRHYFFNRNYGFCEFRGNEFPYGGIPISKDVESDIQTISSTSYETICGTFVPLTREVCWAVPLNNAGYPNYLLFYNVDTGQWRKEDKAMRFVDNWKTFLNYTWNDFISDLGGTGAVWSDAESNYWGEYCQQLNRLVMGYENGHVYIHRGDHDDGGHIEGYRIEPIMDFGDGTRKDLLEEIWIDSGHSLTSGGTISDAVCALSIWHRSGDTVGEVLGQSWSLLGTISLISPEQPVIRCGHSARYHQIKWGNLIKSTKFEIHKLILKYIPQSRF